MDKKIRDDGAYRKLQHGHFLIYKSNEWMFTHIPKNGGSSFAGYIKRKKTLMKARYGLNFLDVGFNRLHNQPQELKNIFNEIEGCKPVCLTRNPWSRCLSQYVFNVESSVRTPNIDQQWSKDVHCRLTREGFKGSWMPGGHFRDNENMQNGINHNPHRTWREDDPQYKWIADDTKWFKLETQLDDFYDFIGIPNPNFVRNTSKHHDYHLYYDDELRDEIAKLYAKDIEMFDYTF
jgi:hypothetical protein